MDRKSGSQGKAEEIVEDFRKNLGPFVVAAEATRMPMAFTNAKAAGQPVVFANDSFLNLIRLAREQVLGRRFSSLLAPDEHPERAQEIKGLFQLQSAESTDLHLYRKDGTDFWGSTFVTPVHDAAGNIVQYFISIYDVSKKHEEQDRASMFIDELNHRVKNTLATVQSVVWQSFRNGGDKEKIQNDIESRLFALSRSHNLLSLARWEGVDLRRLVEAVLEPFAGAFSNREEARIRLAGKNIRLPPKTTLSLAIAIHELATNASKYGSLSNDIGIVLFTWIIAERDGRTWLTLRWEEVDGPPVANPSHRGFGTDIIERGLAHELCGEVNLDFRSSGVVCTISVPGSDDA